MSNVQVSAFGKVAVMLGGRSAEREISLKSGMAVLKGLVAEGVDAHAFDPAAHTLAELLEQGYERVFIALHGRGGEDGAMQGALEVLQLPYTGSGVMACALAMDKARTKQIWQAVGLPTAASCVVNANQPFDAAAVLADLGGKVIVKPAHEGSSIGMSIASTAAQLTDSVKLAGKHDQAVLVEAFLAGPEYTVAILGDEVLPAIKVAAQGAFYDYEAKYQRQDTQYICPAGLADAEEQQVRELARDAFQALDAKGWGRIDMMRDSQGQMQLLEANLVPGMTEKSLVPMAARQAGLSFNQLVLRILAQTLA